MGRLNWIKEVDWKKELNGDMRQIAESVGIDGFISLWDVFAKTSVYFSEGAIKKLKKKYVEENYSPGKVKELARKLDTSEAFIYDIVNGKEGSRRIVNR